MDFIEASEQGRLVELRVAGDTVFSRKHSAVLGPRPKEKEGWFWPRRAEGPEATDTRVYVISAAQEGTARRIGVCTLYVQKGRLS